MSELSDKIETLNQSIKNAFAQLKINQALDRIKELQLKSQAPDFWDDTASAQRIMKEISLLQTKTEPWVELKIGINDIAELNELNDQSMATELSQSLKKLEKSYEVLKEELAFSGPFDDHGVIISIYAGAGGTDAQDWAQMLLRMYTRWVEFTGGQINLIDQSSGDEAGIKSATLEISDIAYAFGKLKGEHGVHRLVRLSPFNSDNLRQTSFAKVDVIPKIDQSTEIEIEDKDLKIDVFRAGGHGGQSVNTTDSAVRITHLPTGIKVSIQNERSQLQNKETAMTVLRSRLAKLKLEQHQEHISDLKGPIQSAEWGNQIRNYVLHPYKQVKDLRSQYETSDPEKVLDGNIDDLIRAYLDINMGSQA